MARRQLFQSLVHVRVRARAGVCGCGVDAQHVLALLLHESAPPSWQPTVEEKRKFF